MAPSRSQSHAFTIKYNGRANRIHTEVSITDAFDPRNPPKVKPRAFKTKALWDTGASGSVITKETAKILGLTPCGTATVGHAAGTSKMNTYMVNIHLPNGVGVPGIRVTECPRIAHGVGAIVGMDIINIGDFSITNKNNETTMSYRLPSMEHIDYVKESRAPIVSEQTVGRNAPCPCGSGKKYKRCCGK